MGDGNEKLTPEQIEKKNKQIKTLIDVVTQKCQEYQQKTDQSLFEELKQERESDDYVNAFVRLAFEGREVEIEMLSYVDKVMNAREAIRGFLNIKRNPN